MKTLLFSAIAGIALLTSSCRKNSTIVGGIDGPTEQLYHVVADGDQLKTEDGKIFKVWGFNLGNGILEDRWNTDWNGVVSDFKEMHEYGANTVRLPLQYEAFMLDSTTPNQAALDKLKLLVKVAEANKLYLIVCGLNAFVKQDQPAWYNNMTDQQRWATQAVFWEAVSEAIGSSPAVLTYDLMNEPVVAVSPTTGWLPGNGLGGYFFVQNIALDTHGQSIETVMRLWIFVMTNAIRKHDTKHLITIGFLPFHSYGGFAPNLSLMSTHLYPKSKEMARDSLTIQKFKSDKPLVISEVFPMNCSSNELQQFIVQQNSNVSGWVWHYNGKTVEELKASGTISDAIYMYALMKFQEMAPSQK